jgi:hypothetical protein
LPPCPYCDTDLPAGTYYCRHCQQNLSAPVESLVGQVRPVRAALPVVQRPYRFASGVRKQISLGLLALGLIAGYGGLIEPTVWPLGALCTCAGIFLFVTGGSSPFKLVVSLALAFVALAPSINGVQRRQRQITEEQRKSVDAKHVALEEERKRAAEAQAEKAAAAAAASFPEKRAAYEKQLAEIDRLIGKREWAGAERANAQLRRELAPVFRSTIAELPAVSTVRAAADKLTERITAHQEAIRQEKLAFENANPVRDLDVTSSSWHKGGFGVVPIWVVTIRNNSKVAVFSDIEYRTSYSAPSGTDVGSNTGTILDVIRPGQTRTFEVNDGFINSQATQASFVITDARKSAP